MLDAVVVVREGAACVIRWVDEDALHLSAVVRFQRFECEQIIAVDQDIVETSASVTRTAA